MASRLLTDRVARSVLILFVAGAIFSGDSLAQPTLVLIANYDAKLRVAGEEYRICSGISQELAVARYLERADVHPRQFLIEGLHIGARAVGAASRALVEAGRRGEGVPPLVRAVLRHPRGASKAQSWRRQCRVGLK